LTVDSENLATRLSKLENQINWLRLTAVIAVALAGAALIVPQWMQPTNVVAERLAVQNSKHELAAMLTTGRDDLPVLALSSADKVRALVGLRVDGGVSLTLSNAEGKLQWSGFINDSGPHVDNVPAK
jgi:hypothetical protein